MAAPASLERLRRDTEQRLKRYCIKPAGSSFALWKWLDGWVLLHLYPSRDAAEDYLFAKLPCPEGEI